ncbi:MAG: Uma2 family endonuclease, partial [Spirochaetaceae bacterium]|nr:Uma2 family endonuclease [Spirochaetaceae bacterium]
MGLPKIKTDQKFTYTEFCSWTDDERWELIDGVAYNMSPAPSSRHQRISFKISLLLGNFLEGKPCIPFTAPFDVYFPLDPDQSINSIDTIVQPDLSVICDAKKIFDKGCMGAPDLIIEILSPSTGKKDLNEKFQLYEKNGVKEYWVVDPGNKYIEIFLLELKGNEISRYDSGTLIPNVTLFEV